MKDEEKFNAIVEAVCYWLGYQFKIGRQQLIHEASLRYPIADTITAKGIEVKRIVLEQLHPIFNSKKIDLVIFDKTVKEPDKEKDDIKLEEVYEFKLAKYATSEKNKEEHQRIFDDLVRLAYYHQWKNKDCYFLMCGKYEDFKTYFVGQKSEIKKEGNKLIVPTRQQLTNKLTFQQLNIETIETEQIWEPEGIYKDWFGFKIDEVKEIEFNKSKNIKFGLKQFQMNYKIREPRLYKYTDTLKIKTRCIAITNTKTHAAGIWKIEALRNY